MVLFLDKEENLPSPRPAFMVSAPGKVIVYGEHAVVYGKAAIAASISLRSYMLVTFLPEPKRTITLCSPDINLNYTWNIKDLPWSSPSIRGRKDQESENITSLDPGLVEALQPHIRSVSPNLPESIRTIHQSSAFAFLYLFLLLSSQDSEPCIYAIRSTIPVGAGLGSSASLAVCIATALLLQTESIGKPRINQPPRETESQINQANKWAFVAEMCIHGNPSGVDNTVSCGGRAVLYQKKDPMKCPVIIPLRRFPELPLLLVNTREPRNASTEITKVRNLRNKYPFIIDPILNAIDSTTESAHNLITACNFEPKHASAQQHLGDLITINHGLLALLGVSHPKLERARELVDQLDIGWTKLTGAGGGGCAIVMPKPGIEIHPKKACITTPAGDGLKPAKLPISSARKMANLDKKLADEGMDMFTTTLAGDGVGVLWPAVLSDVSGEKRSTETDHERFIQSKGKEGIERLVGINIALSNDDSTAGYENSWRFWRR